MNKQKVTKPVEAAEEMSRRNKHWVDKRDAEIAAQRKAKADKELEYSIFIIYLSIGTKEGFSIIF